MNTMTDAETGDRDMTQVIDVATDVHVTVYQDELGRILHNAALFASKDQTRPVFTMVKLRLRGSTLEAVGCTDYYAGADSTTLADDVTATVRDGEWLVLAIDLAPIVKACRTRKGQTSPLVILTFGADGLTVAMVTGSGESFTVAYAPSHMSFPPVDRLFPAVDAKPVALSEIRLDIANLSPFTKVRSDGDADPLRFTFYGDSKAVLIHCGRTFRGLLMPVRVK